MRALTFIFAISSFALNVKAQNFKINLEKTTDKHGLNLKREHPAIRSFRLGSDFNVKPKSFRPSEKPDPLKLNRGLVRRLDLNTWNVNPKTTNIARIPNALPDFVVPEIAAIPNPLLRNRKDFFNFLP